VHGTTAIVALTAQNTVGVTAVHELPSEFVVAQLDAVFTDIGVDAAKTGMLFSRRTVETVAAYLAAHPVTLVVDPVMLASSGATLLQDDAVAALVDRLFPLAAVVTPNLPEARVLAGAGEAEDVETLARRLHDLGPEAVVVTGGHRESATDVFYDGTSVERIPGERHPDGAAHGSGCTHSSALAAHLALGFSPLEAAERARRIASEAVRDGLREIGRGPGPVNALGARVSQLTDRPVGAADPPGGSSARDIMRP
jgi:hydroxymethylpyrimidine/phosphomethylpyrimidine kinase